MGDCKVKSGQMAVIQKIVHKKCTRKNVLQSVKIHLKILGCSPINHMNLPNCYKRIPPECLNTIQIGLIFLILTLNLVSTFCFYIREVKTFLDFSESVFWASRSILSLALYSMLIWYKSDLVQFFDDLDEIVNLSKHSSDIRKSILMTFSLKFINFL